MRATAHFMRKRATFWCGRPGRHLAFFPLCAYLFPVLKMFQGGSREAVFFFGKGQPLSFVFQSGKGKPFPERPPFCPFSDLNVILHMKLPAENRPMPGQPSSRGCSLNKERFSVTERGRRTSPRDIPLSGATAARRSSEAASRGRRTALPAYRQRHGTGSWPEARHRGHRWPAPVPYHRNRR